MTVMSCTLRCSPLIQMIEITKEREIALYV